MILGSDLKGQLSGHQIQKFLSKNTIIITWLHIS